MGDRVLKGLLGAIAVGLLGLILRPSVAPALAQSGNRGVGTGIATDANGFHVYVLHEGKVFLFTRDST